MKNFKAALVALGVLTLGTPALSELSDLEVFNLASQLGNIVGSADGCGIAIDQNGVSAWIGKHMPNGDIRFANQMTGQATIAEINLTNMTPTQKMAHCLSVEAAARGEGMLRE